MYIIPPQLITGDPVTALPGNNPRFPQRVVGPVLVTVVPARTTKLAADPRLTDAWGVGVEAGVEVNVAVGVLVGVSVAVSVGV